MNEILSPAMQFFSFIGVGVIFWIILGVVIFIYEEKRKHIFILYALITASIVWILTSFIKITTARMRPVSGGMCPTDYSFPSQHAAMAFAAATLLTAVDRKRWWVYYAIATLIAISRIYLQCHYVSDVITGALIGISIAVLIVRIVPKHISLFPRHHVKKR